MANIIHDLLGTGYSDNAEFEQAVTKCIPSEFLLIASQDDYTQAQEDYYAMDHFKLGKHVPKFVQKANAGSVATCALLQLMYENPNLLVADNMKAGEEPINCLQLSKELKKRILDCTKLEAKPTISSSRPLGPPRLEKAPPFYILPPGFTGTRRALLIGVVAGEGDDLKGPPNDITNIQQFLTKHCGFLPKNITVLQDYFKTPSAVESFKKNILDGFEKLTKLSQPNDVCFIQFSGHGGRVGNNLYILPSDYNKAGQIMDQQILRDLIKKMPAQVYTTMLVDCCYSGTVGDLPYILQHNSGGKQQIDKYYDTDMRKEMIKKEAEGGDEYQMKKQARSQTRLENRVGGVVDFMSAAAAAGFDATAWAAKKGYDVTAHAVTAGYEAGAKVAAQGYEASAKAAQQGYEASAKAAQQGYEASAKAIDKTAKSATDAAAFTGKKAGEAGKVAASALRTTSKGATEASKQAVNKTAKSATDAAAFTGKKAEEAGKVAASALRTTGKGATEASKQAAGAVTKSGSKAVTVGLSSLTNAASSAANAASSAAKNASSTLQKSTSMDHSNKSVSDHGDDSSSRPPTSSKFGLSSIANAANSAAHATTSAASSAGSSLKNKANINIKGIPTLSLKSGKSTDSAKK